MSTMMHPQKFHRLTAAQLSRRRHRYATRAQILILLGDPRAGVWRALAAMIDRELASRRQPAQHPVQHIRHVFHAGRLSAALVVE